MQPWKPRRRNKNKTKKRTSARRRRSAPLLLLLQIGSLLHEQGGALSFQNAKLITNKMRKAWASLPTTTNAYLMSKLFTQQGGELSVHVAALQPAEVSPAPVLQVPNLLQGSHIMVTPAHELFIRECLQPVSPVTSAVKSALRPRGDSHSLSSTLNAACVSVSNSSSIKFHLVSIQKADTWAFITFSSQLPEEPSAAAGRDWMMFLYS